MHTQLLYVNRILQQLADLLSYNLKKEETEQEL